MDKKPESPRSPDGSELSLEEAYNELQCYTWTHGSLKFIQQHVVDAWAAQTADETTKPMALAFALVGLCLRVESGFSGREIQRIHMKIAQKKRTWPPFTLPTLRGEITAREVLAAPPGRKRDETIDAWCTSVWNAFVENHELLAAWMEDLGVT